MVTTRIQTTRRRLGVSRHTTATRRLPAWPLQAVSLTAERLRVSSLTRVYLAAVALLALIIVYLVVGAQTTQTSYELDHLKSQNAALQAEQGQLRYQDASVHTRAGIAQSASATGLQLTNQATYVRYQPASIDLSAPIGPTRPADTPLWQRILAGLTG